ncbi:MAG: zinc-dependent metalloprotease [Pyrinomonadaceae bacterium]
MRNSIITTTMLVLLLALPIAAQDKAAVKGVKTVTEMTAGLLKIDGYVPLYWNAEEGKLLMEISRWNAEMLYQISLPTGVGSNPIGLDRGQLGDTHVVFFERVGPKVLMIEPNYRYRATSDNAAERRAVEESFARSVLWGFKIEAADGERVIVDATGFFLRDAHEVSNRLRETNQGRFALDESRSALHLPKTKGFPKNTEIEATLTFLSDDPGALVRDTVPAPRALTVRQHHSFVELPDGRYRPRPLDPRVGVNGIDFYDYASPITAPLEKHWIVRHRLEKKDSSAAVSEPIKPIVYYVDNGAPEAIRDALVEGASWWSAAFEAAGFRNAFQVKVLPANADPMDVRFNMITWVHRSTRGWAYGSSIVDPRTGEIIKGNVTLDSQRARQDFLIGTGLIPPYSNAAAKNGMMGRSCGFGMMPEVDYLLASAPADDSAAMSLARIRQLSAHEVGHTLGLAHNFAASTYGRASVMDYPAPMVEIKNGRLDFSNAYAIGIGAYDKFAIKYAYAQFPAGADEAAGLESILNEGVASGMLFISDADARPAGAAHPLANLWDNGDDPIAMLRHEMEVRRIGLNQFGLGNIEQGTPLSLLEAKLLPLYLHHRYQLQAAAKSLGGVYYTYAVKTSAGATPARVHEVVPAARQREALRAVLDTIKLNELVIPPRIVGLIPPRAFGYDGGTPELFTKRTDPVFAPIAAASIAADLAVTELLQHQRAARLIQFHAHDAANPDFADVVEALVAATWGTSAPKDADAATVARAVQSLTVTRLMDLAANADAAPQVRAVATLALRNLMTTLGQTTTPLPRATVAHRYATQQDIERFLNRPDALRKQTLPLPRPQGDPIGAAQ